MKRSPGMPGTSQEPGDPLGTPLGPLGTPLGPPGTPLGPPRDAPKTLQGPPATPMDHNNSHISKTIQRQKHPEALDCCV